ncbi:MAG: hypothetical protein QNK19_13185 [Xanthomonadales bacterium]|nr:hypothetical protein [Xanthomonadales bacterium]
MKHNLKLFIALLAFAFLTSASVQAQTREKILIALETDDIELAETDISALAIGEALTIEAQSGKLIDIIRTAKGAEIYVDGELLEMNFHDEDLHEGHMMSKHVEIVCDGDEECENNVFIVAGDGNDTLGWVSSDGEIISIHREVEITCSDNEEETSCDDHLIWVSDDADFDIGELHEEHKNTDGHKVIVIKKVQTAEY